MHLISIIVPQLHVNTCFIPKAHLKVAVFQPHHPVVV